MEEQVNPPRRTITSYQELLEALATPERYPRFPELTSKGEWKPWSARPSLQCHKTSSVVQPSKPDSRFRRLLLGNHKYRPRLRYDTLPEGCIRLLSIHNASLDGDVLVGFRLITVPLSTAPTYEAISYCWGSTDLCTGIFVSTPDRGEQVYRVTENLASCLHSLITSKRPGHEKPSYIWIDQVCINQQDMDERSVQVRFMADIYKTAAGVIVWLGQESDFVLEDNNFIPQTSPDTQWRDRSVLLWIQEWAIFYRPWFTRLWVFQEAVFAQRIVMLLGPAFLAWDTIKDMKEDFHDFQEEDFDDQYGLGGLEYYMIIYSIHAAKYDMEQKGHVNFGKLMWQMTEQKCQDPRDKIFGLAGFASNILPVDFVDYKLSTSVIVQNCTRHLITETGSLEAITYTNSSVPGRTPSWVPLWHEGLVAGLGLWLSSSSASQHRTWKPTLPEVENHLVVFGKVVSTVATELQSFSRNMDMFFGGGRFADVLQEPFQQAWSYVSHMRNAGFQHKSSENSLSEAKLGRDATYSLDDSSHQPSLEFFANFFCTIFIGIDVVESDFENLIKTPTEGRTLTRLRPLMRWGLHSWSRLFVLESGHLGFVAGPGRGPRAGDSITILHGLDAPCILRRGEDGEGWLYVTEIHIYNIMHGEGKPRDSQHSSATNLETAVNWEEDEADKFILV